MINGEKKQKWKKKNILENWGIQVKRSGKLKLQPSTQSSHKKLIFIVILLKIAKKQR